VNAHRGRRTRSINDRCSRIGAAALIVAGLAFAFSNAGFAQIKRDAGTLSSAKTALVPFENSPFPYRGEVPEKNRPFIDTVLGERRGHASPRGGVYWEDLTYSDRRTLLYIPKGFDPRRPAVIVVFFHGNEAKLVRDVRNRQQVPRQVAQSGLNAVLVAPQFAVDALDSSAGRFWEPGVFAKYLTESSVRLARLYGSERMRAVFERAPVVVAAYSGGYHPLAFILKSGSANQRLHGVILLDAPFGDQDKFAGWLARRPHAFFLSVYGKTARDDNALLQKLLTDRGVGFRTELPANLAPNSVTFIDAPGDTKHVDFVTEGWGTDPLKTLLRRINGFSRMAGTSSGATPKKK
jgi:hypothetical protein